MTLKPYFISFYCLERKISQCIIPLPYSEKFGVKTSDTSSSYTKHNGRLFKTFSTSNKTVNSTVNDNFSLPIDFLKKLLAIPTNLSQKPPHQGAPSNLNFDVIPCSAQKDWLSCDVNTFPLSDTLFFGQPLLAIIFLKLLIKFLLVLSSTRSSRTGLDVLYVNKTMKA